ncbi:NUDIX hydrolase domain-like [Trinorchestia longiramus]|nr:NUDIX hydrolase domain-like [Trinorchestia longiramus]
MPLCCEVSCLLCEQDAAKREVLEETGLEVSITTLLMVECASGSWFRFVVTGNVTGGSLKTPAQADSESLQAMWVTNLEDLSLRGNDIHSLVQRARQHSSTDRALWHSPLLPVSRPATKMLLRLLIAVRKKANNRMCVLVSDKTSTHLPTTEISPVRSLHYTLKKYMTEIFGAELPPHRPQGVLSCELLTSPQPGTHDGFVLTVLVPVRTPLETITIIDKYSWVELPKALGEDLLLRLEKNMIVPLNVIRVSVLIS